MRPTAAELLEDPFFTRRHDKKDSKSSSKAGEVRPAPFLTDDLSSCLGRASILQLAEVSQMQHAHNNLEAEKTFFLGQSRPAAGRLSAVCCAVS